MWERSRGRYEPSQYTVVAAVCYEESASAVNPEANRTIELIGPVTTAPASCNDLAMPGAAHPPDHAVIVGVCDEHGVRGLGLYVAGVVQLVEAAAPPTAPGNNLALSRARCPSEHPMVPAVSDEQRAVRVQRDAEGAVELGAAAPGRPTARPGVLHGAAVATAVENGGRGCGELPPKHAARPAAHRVLEGVGEEHGAVALQGQARGAGAAGQGHAFGGTRHPELEASAGRHQHRPCRLCCHTEGIKPAEAAAPAAGHHLARLGATLPAHHSAVPVVRNQHGTVAVHRDAQRLAELLQPFTSALATSDNLDPRRATRSPQHVLHACHQRGQWQRHRGRPRHALRH
mmetsp:Transcript_70131/g.226973  ORF Transcript_70131/g.226973 Transcript_70131/m.226973 type:complete len:344 (-) Transcript_70131:634-1665(-)